MGKRTKDFTNAVGLRIKQAREQKGLTQKQLGIYVRKGDSTVRMWELGKSQPDLNTISLIAKVLDVSPAFLLNHKEEAQEAQELINIIKGMSGEEVKELSSFVDYIISKRK